MNHMFKDDDEMTAFVSAARAALSTADPVPSVVTNLAKIAFQFRGVSTVRGINATELAAVRASSTASIMQATKDDVTVIWCPSANTVTGVVHAYVGVTVTLQTMQSTLPVAVDANNGSFEYDMPTEPHRLLIKGDAIEWATSWST